MKAVTLPINVLVILSIGIVVLLGLISFFGSSQSGFGGLEALLQDLTGKMESKSKTARCEEMCKNLDPSGKNYYTKQGEFCSECRGIKCDNLIVENYCDLSTADKKVIKELRR
ncbi:MAG: hypothetical protein ABEK36_00720 [Candidatus Aenigmatarchaeota archaeon]